MAEWCKIIAPPNILLHRARLISVCSLVIRDLSENWTESSIASTFSSGKPPLKFSRFPRVTYESSILGLRRLRCRLINRVQTLERLAPGWGAGWGLEGREGGGGGGGWQLRNFVETNPKGSSGMVMSELNSPWRILLQRMDYPRYGTNPASITNLNVFVIDVTLNKW